MDNVWDLSGITNQAHRDWINEALDRTNFNFNKLIPGLVAQVRRSTIPVLFSDLSRYNVRAHGDTHVPDGAHAITRVVEGRKRVLGLAWYSGKVEIEATCPKDLAMEVFLAEGAHMVDFFWLTPDHRERIFDAYHTYGNHTHPHGSKEHGWFEETGNNDYWSWVGESFMYGFIAAFSTVPATGDNFVHKTTAQIGVVIKNILMPTAIYARNVRSNIVHRVGGWHERQIPDHEQITYYELDGDFRRCKTCNWKHV